MARSEPALSRERGRVSVCVPVFNGARYLAESIESIVRQTYPLLEIVICDDASTDETPRIAAELAGRDPRIRVIRADASTGHAFAASNWTISATRGDYVALYHADDLYDPSIVEREAAFLDSTPLAGAVFALPRFIDAAGQSRGMLELPPEIRGVTTFDCATLTNTFLRYKNVVLSAPSAMLRRSAFDNAGGFDQETYGAQADGDLWLRLAYAGKIGLIHEHLLSYRFHPGQWSRKFQDLRTIREPFFRLMDHHLSRPGVRETVNPSALDHYRMWEAKDETERAANALVLGDRARAKAIMRASLVKPLIKSSARAGALRILALKAIVYVAAKSGGGRLAQKAVYAARFRKRMPAGLKEPREAINWQLDDALHENVQHRKRPSRTTVRVYIDPMSYHHLGDGLFDAHSKWNRDGSLKPWIDLRQRLLEEGIETRTADYLETKPAAGSINVYSALGIHDGYQRFLGRSDVILNSFTFLEPVMYAPAAYAALGKLSRDFRKVYLATPAESIAKYVDGPFTVTRAAIPAARDSVIEKYWSNQNRKGVLFVYTNRARSSLTDDLLEKRLVALEYFAARGDTDLWGRRWDNESLIPPRFRESVKRSWRGALADKYEAYSRARFVFCSENTSLDGWITEKIFDCFCSGAIPIYVGAPDILDWIPRECFIDPRDFTSYEELGRFLDSLTPGDLDNYRIAGRDFLASEKFAPFAHATFAERFVLDIKEALVERGDSVTAR